MIGALAGDIISSPYTHSNLSDPSQFIGWNLFEDYNQIYFSDKSGARIDIDEF